MIPLSRLAPELEKVAKKYTFTAERKRAALQEIDRYLIDRVEESFTSRQTPEGKAWPGQATLVKTGGLFAAATAPGEIKDGQLRRKTRHKLATILQRGARKPRKKKKRAGGARRGGGILSLVRAAKLAQKAAKIAADIASGKATAAAWALIEVAKENRGQRKKRKRRKKRKGGFRIPPRPFEGITERDGKLIAAIVARHAIGVK
jgi:hypothetical protein